MQEGGGADHTDAPFPDFRFDLPVIPEPPALSSVKTEAPDTEEEIHTTILGTLSVSP